MDTDELRREIAGLADDIEPFAGDVDALHRRVRRTRLVTGAIAVSLIVVAAVLTTTAVRGHDRTRVHISGAPDKEVSLAGMTHVDAIVVPATPEVKELLDSSRVERYALVPRGSLTSASDNLLDPRFCFLKSSAGYAVAVDSPVRDLMQRLSTTLQAKATVHDVSDNLGADAEIFMRVGAPVQATEALRTELQRDPDIASMHYVSQNDAFAIFRREFASDPEIIRTTHAQDLPVSFRLIMRDGHPATIVKDRYSTRAGVDTVISVDFGQAVEMSLAVQARLHDSGRDRGDAEIYLHVGAPDVEVAGVRSALERDSEVKSFRMLDQQQAHAIFAEEYADQPSLVQETKPSDLPVSFRVTPRPGISWDTFTSKYQGLAGVDTVIAPNAAPPETTRSCP